MNIQYSKADHRPVIAHALIYFSLGLLSLVIYKVYTQRQAMEFETKQQTMALSINDEQITHHHKAAIGIAEALALPFSSHFNFSGEAPIHVTERETRAMEKPSPVLMFAKKPISTGTETKETGG